MIAASLLSAVAALVGLNLWVAVAAGVTTILSGVQVIRAQLLVPVRVKAAQRAVVPVAATLPDGKLRPGSAFQYKPGRWLTAAHVLGDEGIGVRLRIGNAWAEAKVTFRDTEADLAVLECLASHPWTAKVTPEVPDEGDGVRVVGWTAAEINRPRIRVALDYVVQSETDHLELVVTGPNPQRGFGGGPAIEMQSGKIFGVFSKFHPGYTTGHDLREPLQESYIASIRQLPNGML